MVTLDVPHVFRVFGGPRGLLISLGRWQPDHGLEYSTVQMWKQRGAIPARWLCAILYTAEQEGRQCREFMVDTAEFAATTPDKTRKTRAPRARPRG